MKKQHVFFALMFALSTAVAPVLFGAPQGIDVTIRYFDQKIVYADSRVPIKVEITNNSPQSYQFELADQRVFSLDFDARSLTNVPVDHADQFNIARNSNQPVFFRTISIAPGEQFSFVADLSSFVKIPGAGVFVVRAMFYPQLYASPSSDVIMSNQLTLNVNPGSMTALAASIEQETGQILRQEALPPDEVVSYLLHARQKSQWNRFFLYIDLTNLMLQQPDLKRRYDRSSDQAQRDMVQQFKSQLMQQLVDPEIALIPSDFTILKTDYTPTEATVEVLEKFNFPTYTELKRYTYYLHRPEQVWLLYNYTVENLGTQ